MMERWRRTNAPGKRQIVLAVLWAIAGVVIMVTSLRESVELLQAITIYTVVQTHWATFQAATPSE